jgi:hypothetical protein
MTAAVIRFPPRCSHVVWIAREDAAWLVLARGHGWLHATLDQARADARWLAHNLAGLPIRVTGAAP